MNSLEKLILQTITDYLNENGFEVDLDNEMIHVHISFNDAIITLEDNDITISFSITTNPTDSAIITKLVMEASAEYKIYKVEICEPYLEVFDENDEFINMLFGEEIFDYMDDLDNKILNN